MPRTVRTSRGRAVSRLLGHPLVARQPVMLQNENPAPIGGSRRGAVACLGNKPPAVHCKFELTAGHSQLSKGGGQRSKGGWSSNRPYILWAGGRPIAPREIPTRDERARANGRGESAQEP